MSSNDNLVSSRRPNGPSASNVTFRNASHRNRVIEGRITKLMKSAKNLTRGKESIRVPGSVLPPVDSGEDRRDETNELPEELLVPNAEDMLNYLHNIARESAAMHEASMHEASSEDRSRSPTIYSSATQETNTESNPDYDLDDGWRYEQIYINQILKARDEYTLMPTTWRMHFRGVPLPDGLFYVKTQAVSARPRIYALNDRLEYQGATALRRLMEIHGRIRDLRKDQKILPGNKGRIARHITKRLRDALHWAELDGGFAEYSRALASNVTILEVDNVERLKMDTHIQEQMSEFAAEWRAILRVVPEKQRPVAPVLFGFVILKHILFIVTLNSNDPKAKCHVPCQLNLSERNQQQWNALAIMVTICWARDLFLGLVKSLPVLDFSGHDKNPESSDPDV